MQRWQVERTAGLDEGVQMNGESYTDIWRPDIFFAPTGLTTTARMRQKGMTVEQRTRINTTGQNVSYSL